MTSGVSHPYHLDESIFLVLHVVVSGVFFLFSFPFAMQFMYVYSIATNEMPRFAILLAYVRKMGH